MMTPLKSKRIAWIIYEWERLSEQVCGNAK